MQTALINAEKINITSTLKDKINIVFELTKLRITFFITLTTILGFISFTGKFTEGIIAPVIGIMLLSSGSAVINHYQERNTDALMARTKRRPIPSGKISSTNALKFAIILVLSGSIVLILGSGLKTLALGLLNLVWYNLIYTPLKRKNALAIVPGSLVGALPPMIGWVSAGGNLTDPRILILSFFFFIWQIPHFWLLLLIFGKDYEQAGFPTLTQVFNLDQLSRITFIWIMATVVTCMLIPMFGIVKNIYIVLALLTAGMWLSWNTVKLLKVTDKKILFRLAFKEINLFAVYVVLILSINQLLI